jgi:hypothetical protein
MKKIIVQKLFRKLDPILLATLLCLPSSQFIKFHATDLFPNFFLLPFFIGFVYINKYWGVSQEIYPEISIDNLNFDNNYNKDCPQPRLEKIYQQYFNLEYLVKNKPSQEKLDWIKSEISTSLEIIQNFIDINPSDVDFNELLTIFLELRNKI